MSVTPPPLVVFHHIPKNAGSSLRVVVKSNYRPHEMIESYGAPLDPDWHRLWWSTFSARERSEVRCVAGHTANGLIPVLDRPFKAFCVVRHPVEHVLSLRDYMIHRNEVNRAEMPGGRVPGSWAAPGVLDRTGWSIRAIYAELGTGGVETSETHRRMAPFFDGQSRLLAGSWPDLPVASSYTPGEGARAGPLLERMERDYVVGVQDRMERSVQRFAQAFGWRRVFMPRKNAESRQQRASDLSPAARELILAHNQVDLALYEHYARELGRR